MGTRKKERMEGPRIQARVPKLPPRDGLPRHWFRGNALSTALANGMNLVFPAGERFFMRSVLHYRDQIGEGPLREQVKAFCGQEGQHAQAHERLFETLRTQGYEIDGYLRGYERLAYEWIEPKVPPELRLAVTVALEHFTAVLAENALREDTLDTVHPHMRELLRWHASEEIEHKAVAFEVLQQVAPGYGLRMTGLGLAALGLAVFWAAGALTLLRQEREVGWKRIWKELREVRKLPSLPHRVLARGIREYVRRDFHPWQNDNLGLAQDYLAAAGMA